ncbi:DNA-directed RNA polymerase I subunit rpa2 [Physocladia obscura]|uniref:DNA-directed RNA polymerase I subunit rpa2 n=1 Tax=Physocladia obscura TaxID=109957 RepID=A0AAD5SZE7_9FUNG|nr:DNA-directed RNA polymerase I subunit rpa2 [Physocladia obscura]
MMSGGNSNWNSGYGGAGNTTKYNSYGNNNNSNSNNGNNYRSNTNSYSPQPQQQGGFSNSQHVAGFADSPSTQKKFTNQSLRPVSIKHLLRAKVETEGNPPSLDGEELGLVKIIGRVSKASVNSTSLKYVVSDGPYNIECSKFVGADNVDGNDYNTFSEGTYVKIIGTAKMYKNAVTLSNIFVFPVPEFDEITYHNLECVYIHLLLTRGDPMTVSNMTADQSNAYNSTAYAAGGSTPGGGAINSKNHPYSHLPRVQGQIMLTLSKSADPVPRDTIFAALRGVANDADIGEALQSLENEGHLYDNGDSTYQITA